MDKPTTEIEPRDGADELDDLATVKAALLDGTLEVEVDPAKMSRAIVERILEAPSEAVFEPDQVIHARDLLGRPFKVRGVRWFPSSFDEGPAVYAVADSVMLDTGEICVVTLGATRALAQLYRAVKDGLLPIDVRVVEATRPTAAGFYPYHLEAVKQPQGQEG